MKKTLIVGLLGLTYAMSGQAATAAGNFDVVLNLTSKCEINSTAGATGAVISPLTMNYTSFQTTAASGSTSFNVRCTNSLPYTVALDAAGAAGVTDDAVGLAYTLSLSAASGTGTGVDQPITVNGSMIAGQAGTCALASCTNAAATNKQRTLTISY